ncbi:MAG: cobalamin biosynthesis protein CobQ, partial [Clostridia bacterium]|nr:cobalamin biosynthesis protein CobQ [Clostridia bacterium]
MGNRITDHKVHIFVGMFGSGKTEAAINFSIRMRNIFDKVSIADIDIISPYFRTRDKAEFLENKDIKVILPPKIYLNADLPIISPAVGGYISNPEYKIILDVGGNDDGIMVIGSLNNFLQNADAAVYFVINTMRPFTDSEEKISSHIDRLSQKA